MREKNHIAKNTTFFLNVHNHLRFTHKYENEKADVMLFYFYENGYEFFVSKIVRYESVVTRQKGENILRY